MGWEPHLFIVPGLFPRPAAPTAAVRICLEATALRERYVTVTWLLHEFYVTISSSHLSEVIHIM